jgi:hypothetical protein
MSPLDDGALGDRPENENEAYKVKSLYCFSFPTCRNVTLRSVVRNFVVLPFLRELTSQRPSAVSIIPLCHTLSPTCIGLHRLRSAHNTMI